jgi:hypothetical protein
MQVLLQPKKTRVRQVGMAIKIHATPAHRANTKANNPESLIVRKGGGGEGRVHPAGPLTYSSGVICRTSCGLLETIKEYLLYLQSVIKHTYICMPD